MVLEHVAIAVSQLGRSVDFYTDVLGFRLLRRTSTNAFVYLDENLIELIQGNLQAEPGPTAAEDWQRQRVSAFGLNHIGFRVKQITPALLELERSGLASVVIPPYEFIPDLGFVEGGQSHQLDVAARPEPGKVWKLAVVADPDGTLLELVER